MSKVNEVNMNKLIMYYLIKKGTDERIRNMGRPWAVTKKIAEDAIKTFCPECEMILVADYEKHFVEQK